MKKLITLIAIIVSFCVNCFGQYNSGDNTIIIDRTKNDRPSFLGITIPHVSIVDIGGTLSKKNIDSIFNFINEYNEKSAVKLNNDSLFIDKIIPRINCVKNGRYIGFIYKIMYRKPGVIEQVQENGSMYFTRYAQNREDSLKAVTHSLTYTQLEFDKTFYTAGFIFVPVDLENGLYYFAGKFWRYNEFSIGLDYVVTKYLIAHIDANRKNL